MVASPSRSLFPNLVAQSPSWSKFLALPGLLGTCPSLSLFMLISPTMDSFHYFFKDRMVPLTPTISTVSSRFVPLPCRLPLPSKRPILYAMCACSHQSKGTFSTSKRSTVQRQVVRKWIITPKRHTSQGTHLPSLAHQGPCLSASKEVRLFHWPRRCRLPRPQEHRRRTSCRERRPPLLFRLSPLPP